MTALRHVAIVGGSQAGVTAANTLRTAGFDGRITLYSAEERPPYSRPPLSKDILLGRGDAASADFHVEEGVELRLGVRATGLDARARRLRLSTGEEAGYDGLVIATGARARSLARTPEDATDELRLRTMDDALDLRERLKGSGSVAVAGGGPLGMEIASVCRDLGRDVTVVDFLPPMRRQVGGYLAELITEAARDTGVRFVQTAGPAHVAGHAVVSGGHRVAADVVVTAAGELPNVEWLAGSGLIHADGLFVDHRLWAAPGVVAAGDVVLLPTPAGPVRTPLWTNALDQGKAAATTLLTSKSAPAYQARPYFWTEQFGLSIKVCGTIPGDAPPVVVTGDRAERALVLQWLSGGVPVAAATVNHRMPVAGLRRLATADSTLSPSRRGNQ
ncbi:NAD(P)/FAD-dependent oxidoreductase [Streptosporangium jomthongense]|uniref:NAD(P)/FAD-dependent oxidoreductase n=1 Tax=Streptosporangium jomthongense TaxID=1193683 RepID=A0ABV8F2J0_9ACTN